MFKVFFPLSGLCGLSGSDFCRRRIRHPRPPVSCSLIKPDPHLRTDSYATELVTLQLYLAHTLHTLINSPMDNILSDTVTQRTIILSYCEMHSELNNKVAKVTSIVTNIGTLMIWNLFIVYWNKHKQAGMCTCIHIWTHGRVYFCESPSVWVGGWVGVYQGCLWVTNTSFACELSNVQLCKWAKKTFPVSLCYLLISQFWN